MRELQSELRSLYIKLGVFYFFLLFDLVWSSFIEPTTKTQISMDTNDNSTQILWINALHIIITAVIFILFCTLIWQTQPLKLGMVKLLFRDFFYVFLTSGIMLIIVVVERIAIFVTNTGTKSIISNVIQDNWASAFYQIMFYVRYILRPFYLLIMLHGSLKIAKPYYHMRNPELFLK